MAGPTASKSEGDEFYSMSIYGADDVEEEEEETGILDPPVHPISSFQGAFEESIVESTEANLHHNTKSHQAAETRRRKLLEAKVYDDGLTTWKYSAGSKYHPFTKLIAQIVFGIHLIQQGAAISNEEVVKILQNHVNEVDNFLEQTSADFDLAISDIEERIRHLKLPMQHIDVFEVMLDNKKFRTDLLNGNDKIETIIDRTAKAMNTTLVDIQSGISSTKELRQYLDDVEKRWPAGVGGIAEVYGAMRGNEQGWMSYLRSLEKKGHNLSNTLETLGAVVGEISKHAAAASRRNRPQSRTDFPSAAHQSTASSPGVRSRLAKDAVFHKRPSTWLDKPLPKEPDASGGAVVIPRPHPVPYSTRYEQPRQFAPKPDPERSSSGAIHRPKRDSHTAGPRDSRATPIEAIGQLASFLRHSRPLRSNPPDAVRNSRTMEHVKKPGRSQSQTADNVLGAYSKPGAPATFRRSRSQGDIAVAKLPQDQSTPRQAVGSSNSVTTIKLVPSPEAQTEAPDPKITANSRGFSRRISRRLQKLPPPIKHNTEPVVRPMDSAYSSMPDRQRSTSSPTNFTSDTDKDLPPDPVKEFAGETDHDIATNGAKDDEVHTGSPLCLFSSVLPSSASVRSSDNTPSSKAWVTSVENSPKSTHSSKASRPLSIRNFFHRKGDKRVMAAS